MRWGRAPSPPPTRTHWQLRPRSRSGSGLSGHLRLALRLGPAPRCGRLGGARAPPRSPSSTRARLRRVRVQERAPGAPPYPKPRSEGEPGRPSGTRKEESPVPHGRSRHRARGARRGGRPGPRPLLLLAPQGARGSLSPEPGSPFCSRPAAFAPIPRPGQRNRPLEPPGSLAARSAPDPREVGWNAAPPRSPPARPRAPLSPAPLCSHCLRNGSTPGPRP